MSTDDDSIAVEYNMLCVYECIGTFKNDRQSHN